MEGPTPPPPPAPAKVVTSAVGLPDVGASFVSGTKGWKEQHEAARRAKLKQLEVPLTPEGQFDVTEAVPLDLVDWSAVSRIHCSAGGSAGVFFCTFADGRHVVLKGSMEPAREIFMTRIMRLVNQSAPHIREVSFGELEYSKIKECVSAHLQGEDLHKATKQLLRPQILLMEYCKGVSMLSMTPELVKQFFDVGRSPTLSRPVLQSIGRIMALDILFNNWDRIPLIHSNEGNFGNLMLQPHSGHIVAIDNALTSIVKEISKKPNPNYDRYLGLVSTLSAQLCASGVDKECAMVAAVRNKIQEGTGVLLGVPEGLCLQQGLVDMLIRIAGLGDILARERTIVAEMVAQSADWEGVWAKDVALIDLQFFNDVIARIQVDALRKVCKAPSWLQ